MKEEEAGNRFPQKNVFVSTAWDHQNANSLLKLGYLRLFVYVLYVCTPTSETHCSNRSSSLGLVDWYFLVFILILDFLHEVNQSPQQVSSLSNWLTMAFSFVSQLPMGKLMTSMSGTLKEWTVLRNQFQSRGPSIYIVEGAVYIGKIVLFLCWSRKSSAKNCVI